MQSYRNPKAQWLGAPSFALDREGHDTSPPFYIVCHTMVGNWEAANARFQNAANQVSAHYGVCLDGSLKQWVDEKDAAYHAGVYGVNLDSIGIEHEDGGQYNSPRPLALKQTSAALLADLCRRYSSIPLRRGNVHAQQSGVVLHREIVATGCPDSLEVDEIIGMAQVLLHPPPPTSAPVPGPGAGAGRKGPFDWLSSLLDWLARILGLRR